MDPIKEAFSKIKDDIFQLKQEISSLKEQLNFLNTQLSSKLDSVDSQTAIESAKQSPTQTSNFSSEIYQQTNKPTNKPTQNQALDSLKPLNLHVSSGNRGVPTNKPTNQQTDKPTENTSLSSHNPSHLNPLSSYTNFPDSSTKDPIDEFRKANEIISSLDDIKKEIRIKFKELTPQEMSVFSTLYALEDQNITQVTYKLLADNLHLSESSIRDYINKITKKGVPIDKIRQNNKTIILKIYPGLKNIATLTTIHRLREL